MNVRDRLKAAAVGAVVAGTMTTGAFAASDLVVGVPHWPSAQVTAHILKQTVEREFDTNVRLRPMGTQEIFDAVDRGEVDVHPEVWLPNSEELVKKYAVDRGTLRLSPRGVPAAQNICTTPDTVEQ
ncbi:MAG: glycine betaine ABC transporter substrate-binding protein, partial [Pseudomonadota bacterium]